MAVILDIFAFKHERLCGSVPPSFHPDPCAQA